MDRYSVIAEKKGNVSNFKIQVVVIEFITASRKGGVFKTEKGQLGENFKSTNRKQIEKSGNSIISSCYWS